jgi:FdhD protein
MLVQQAPYCASAVQRWRDGALTWAEDCIAEEVPVALVYSGVPHVVMLATPQDLEDFAVGFTLSEQIVHANREVKSMEIHRRDKGIEVHLCIPRERFVAMTDRQRNLAGRTGCGLCGAQNLEQAVRRPPPVPSGVAVSAQELHQAMQQLTKLQRLNTITGAVHAAAWAIPGQGVRLIREDVGRHNALDKLIGALARAKTDFSQGYVLVTSRASYEMVQKAATVGISLMAAISAPTGLAVRLAEESRLTLAGFTRNGSHVVYAHPERIHLN